jgi:PAS domain S-box-containing protein
MLPSNTLLVIDDDPNARLTVKLLLTTENYQIIFAADGPEGLTQAVAHRPDVILLDVMLPGLDGYEVCRQLRADERLAEVPILMVTALIDHDSRLRGLEAGADDFLSKPFDRAEMVTRLRVIARLNRYRRLLAERQKFQQFVEYTSDGIVLCDEVSAVIEWNGAMEQISGVLRAQALSRPLWEILAPETGDLALEQGQTLESLFRHPDGTHRILEISPFLFPSETGFRLGAIVRDLTERRRAQETIQRLNLELQQLLAERTARLEQEMAAHAQTEQSLQESQDLFRTAQDMSLEAFTILRCVRNNQGEITDFMWTYANQAAGKILRQPPYRLIGQKLLETLPGNRINRDLFDRYVQIVESGQGNEIELKYEAEGIAGWFRNRTIKLGDGVAVAFSDITQQKQAEATLRQGKEELERRVAEQTATLQAANERLRQEIAERKQVESALRESEGQLKRSQQMAHIGHWIWDARTHRLQWSDEMYRLMGMAPEPLEGPIHTLLQHVIHPDDLARIQAINQVQASDEPPQDIECRVIWPDGSVHYLWALPGDRVTDNQGQTLQLSGVVQDITERKAAEAELRQRDAALVELNVENTRLTQQTVEVEGLRQADRWRSELIANVSHELRTPLGLVLVACTTLLRTDLTMGRETQLQFLNAIRDETRKLQELVENLLHLSRLQGKPLELQRRPVPLEPLIRETFERMAPLLGQHTVVCELSPLPLVAVIDAHRIEQVLRNLLSNAAKYSPPGSTITVQGSVLESEIQVKILDEGIGLTADDLDHLFERFYRGRTAVVQKVSGLGLGLAICHSLIEAHGGRIWAEQRLGGGAGFCFTLPGFIETEEAPAAPLLGDRREV